MVVQEGILFAYFDLNWSHGEARLLLKKSQMVKGRLRTKTIDTVKKGDLLFQVVNHEGNTIAQSQLKVSKMQPIGTSQSISFDIKIPWTKPSQKLVVYQQEGILKKIEEYEIQTILGAN